MLRISTSRRGHHRGSCPACPTSKLAEAIRYATSRRIALERFLSDGRIEIDSNTVERAIRPQTITRKKCALRGQPWRRPDLGDHRHAAADHEDEWSIHTPGSHKLSSGSRTAGRSLRSMLSCPGTSKRLNGFRLALAVEGPNGESKSRRLHEVGTSGMTEPWWAIIPA